MSKQTRVAIVVFCVCLTVSMLSGVAAYWMKPDWFSPQPPVTFKVGNVDIDVNNLKFTPSASKVSPLPRFASLEELMGYLKANGALYEVSVELVEREVNGWDGAAGTPAPPAAAPEPAPMPETAENDMASGGDDSAHSTVNSQVGGVAEGDIAVTDGKYIYAYASMTGHIAIVRADGADLRQVAAIPLSDGSDNYGWGRLSEMYITGDYLVTVSSRHQNLGEKAQPELVDDMISCIWYPSRQFTQYTVYDVSDRANPVQTRVFEVEGSPLSTRMIGTDLYFVSSRYIYPIPLSDMGEGDILPLYRDTADKMAYQAMAPEDIYYFPDSRENSYLIVGAFDVTGDAPAQVDSYLGAGATIYMNSTNLYIARADWSNSKTQTRFYRFDVERSTQDATPAVRYAAEAAVTGSLLNQYSMDEFSGVFRAALTDWNVGNYIYTFDAPDMRGLARTEPLAHDEQIRSVRFMGDMAYMVTFRQTDPLFCIDLSDPRKPLVLGELKIPGFSSYLHPLGDGLMIGFGRNVQETYVDLPGGGREVVGTIDLGAKISLFDLNDPTNPLEIDVLNLERDTWSPAFDNPRAIMVDSQRKIFGFGVTNYGKSSMDDMFTSRLIAVRDRRLADLATLKDGVNDDTGYYYKEDRRLCYIGDTLYTVTAGTVTAFDYTTFEKVGQLVFTK